jgi:hypothetical protein
VPFTGKTIGKDYVAVKWQFLDMNGATPDVAAIVIRLSWN